MTRTDPRVTLTRLSQPRDAREELAADVRRGLTGPRKWLPPKHLYDARGSELFELITQLPEYPLTRTETAILEAAADDLVAASGPHELVELGSGSSRKTRLLLEAMYRLGAGETYAPLDVSEAAIEGAAAALADDHPWLRVHGYVGDFHTDLHRVPRDGRRLLAFLGSTVGNLDVGERAALFTEVTRSLAPGDRFLLGIDLVKPAAVLEPAYDDAAGITAAFTRNLLTVVNRELGGDLPEDAFEHRARWDAEEERVELTLVASRDVRAYLADLDLDVRFGEGEALLVEHSHKFRLERLAPELVRAGLRVESIHTDPGESYALLSISHQ